MGVPYGKRMLFLARRRAITGRSSDARLLSAGRPLYLNNQGHNHFVDTPIAAQSSTQDKVYVAQTWRDQQATSPQRRRGDVYLTVFIDKNKDGRFTLTSPAEYEFVILHF
jgi:hypothetical protein